ncbi:hypothetical protein niasHT_004274 [Heterodera trifolii]|uniref:FAM69 protein-kinase domain-containing protein n=1 Tax=Heterodera trifolii TaxID=157864 RepID=A0ABD2LNV2_9BILA
MRTNKGTEKRMASKRRKRKESSPTTEKGAISALVRRWRLRCVSKAQSMSRAGHRCFVSPDAEPFVCLVCCVCLMLSLFLFFVAMTHFYGPPQMLTDGDLPAETQPQLTMPYNSSMANSIISALCAEWRVGHYSGDFCDTLCAGVDDGIGTLPRNWTLADYTRGGNKHVLKMRILGHDAVLKMQFPFADEYDQQIDFDRVDEEEFTDKLLDLVNLQLRLGWPRRYKRHLLRRIWPPLADDDGAVPAGSARGRQRWRALDAAEKRSVWALLQQDEFINSALLQLSRVTPKLLGVCGHAYLVEYLVPFRMKPYYLNLKAKILVHLMGTLKLFNEFLNEPLHWCDVKFDNLGLSANYPKRFVMMDSDLMFTQSRLNAMLQAQQCSNDTECGLFDCASQCNTTTGHCTGRTNDNVDVFCRKLIVQQLFGNFWTKSNRYLAACHENATAESRLKSLQMVWAWSLSDV